MRQQFFGPAGTTRAVVRDLVESVARLPPLRSRYPRPPGRARSVPAERPDFIIHTAAQPSHDKAASIPYDDFDVNAVRHHEHAGGGARLLPGVPVLLHQHQQGLRRSAEYLPLRETREALGLRRRAGRHRRKHVDRQLPALGFRRFESGGRRDVPGVRPLLQDADRRIPRRLPHRAAAFRRRTARLSGVHHPCAP